MAVTVVNPNQGQQGQQATQNLQSILQGLNQRRHEIEKQQREYEANIIGQYAADHGGWANVLTMPGGEDMFQHYTTNVLGYDPEVTDKAKEAVKQGYNPEEAAYRINREMAFMRNQQSQNQPMTEEGKQAAEQQNVSGFDPSALQGQVQERTVRDNTPKEEPRRSDNKTFVGDTAAPAQTDDLWGMRKMAEQTASDELGKGIDVRGVGKLFTGGAQTLEEAQTPPHPGREGVSPREDPIGESTTQTERTMDFSFQESNKQLDKMAGDILRNNPLFNEKIPYYSKEVAENDGVDPKKVDIMTKKQRESFDKMKSYLRNVEAGTSPEQVISGARDLFDTIGKRVQNEGKELTSGQRKAEGQQIKNRSVQTAKDLALPENLGEFARMNADNLKQYRANIDWMQENDPQRWAETYGSGLKAAQGLSEKEYKDALAAGQLLQNGIQKMQLEMKQQAMQGDEQAAQMETALKLLEFGMKNPKMAKRDEFKDFYTGLGAFANNLIAGMVARSPKELQGVMKTIEQKDSFWKFWDDANLQQVWVTDKTNASSSGDTRSRAAQDLINQYLNNQ